MLMPTCLKPYPGELLYGWIVRLFRVNMYDSLEKFCAAYIPYEDRKFNMGKPVPVRLITDSIWTIYARKTENSNVSRMSGV